METIFTCTECSKTFKSKMALSGHKRVHNSPAYNPPKVDRRVTCERTGKRVLPEHWDTHQSKLRVCQNPACGKDFIEQYNTSGMYCSQSCSATITNLARGPMSEDQKRKISETLKRRWGGSTPENTACIPKPEKKYPSSKVYRKDCPECEKSFYVQARSQSQKFCSLDCAYQASSSRMIQKIANQTAGNFSTKIPNFVYKDIKVDCDSKLEATGVMYLVDLMSANRVERCRSIINYKDPHGKNHKFLPDFYVAIGDRRMIVEVKQVWKQSPKTNKYNRYFAEKRQALVDFCNDKNLESLWLDFDHDPVFHTMYKNFLKSKLAP